jgi:hypothetical protein
VEVEDQALAVQVARLVRGRLGAPAPRSTGAGDERGRPAERGAAEELAAREQGGA